MIENQDASGLSTSARDMALVFQNFSLYPDWSVRKNLEFPLKAPGYEIFLYWHANTDGDPANLWLREQLVDALKAELKGGRAR